MPGPIIAPLGGAVTVSATASSVSAAIVMPAGANALHIANTSTTLYVTVTTGQGSATAVLGTGAGITIPPMDELTIEANPRTDTVAAIGSGAGPTPVVFTPCRVLA